MPKMFYRVISIIGAFLLCFLLLFSCTTVCSAKPRLYIIGRSFTKPQYPIVVNPEVEELFRSEIVLSRGARYEVFLDSATCKFIIVRSQPIEKVEVFQVGIYAKELPPPVFCKMHKMEYRHSRAVWSPELRILLMVGRSDIAESSSNLILTCLRFQQSGYDTKVLHLEDYLGGLSDIWVISDSVFILGYRTRADAIKGGRPNVSIVMSTNDWSLSPNKFASMIASLNLSDIRVVGLFDSEHLAVADKESVYTYDLENLERVGDKPKCLRTVFGKSIDGKGYYAELEKGLTSALGFVPWANPQKPITLFKGTLPGDLHGLVYTEEALRKAGKQ